MPVILGLEGEKAWLEPGSGEEELKGLLGPYMGKDMAGHRVSKMVNSPSNQGPEIIEPAPKEGLEVFLK